MYCKHCGKEIADDSLFCQHCGEKQSELTSNETTRVETETKMKEKVVEIPTIKAHFSDATKWWIIGCGIWIVINLYWLFAGDKSSSASEHFQPFSDKMDSSYSYYDITEFIVYVVGLPFIVWGLIMLNKKLNSDTTPHQNTSTPVAPQNEDDINKALGI